MYYTLNAFKATFGIATIEYDNLILHYLDVISRAIDETTLTNFKGIAAYNDQIYGNNLSFVPIKIWSGLTTVELKTFGSTTGQVLLPNVDYLAKKIPGKNQIYAIKFFNRIVLSNQFLDITGTFGFNYLPAEIESILLNSVLTAVNYQATKTAALNNEQAGATGGIESITNLSSSVRYKLPDNYLENAEKIASGNLSGIPGVSDVLLSFREYSNPTTFLT